MSYRRRFSKTIAVHYSGTVSYPPSEDGGTVSYSGTEYEDVVVSINVDTNSFDGSVRQCKGKVDLLTGAVAASEAAQVASIRQSSRKIGKSIIRGFFKTVASDISQQIAELRNRIDSTLLHLQATGQRCMEKRQQMSVDYNRLKQRYTQIFDDLDNELRNRIHELDKAVFAFKQTGDGNALRTLTDDLVGTAAISATESRLLEAQISASMMKKRAMDTIQSAAGFIDRQQANDRALGKTMLAEDGSGVVYVPVCLFEVHNGGGITDHMLFQPDGMQPIDEETLREGFNQLPPSNAPRSDADLARIRECFAREVAMGVQGGAMPRQGSHEARVIEYMNKMFNANIKTC